MRFVQTKVHSIEPVPGTDDLRLRYVGEDGRPIEETFDMVVLSTGLEISPDVVRLLDHLGVAMDPYHFTRSDSFHPVATSVPGIFACGVLTGPKDIPQSVMEASAAACAATENLAPARNTLTRSVEAPPEKDVVRQLPRIGVFVCNCGINIGGVVRVPEVADYAKTLPHVVYVEENLFTCSQDTQDKISQVIKDQGLNRVVVAACTPRTHESLFQETLINAGLNKYLVEMANIRNHDAWVHADDPDAATEKAKDLVRMAVAKSALLNPLQQTDLPVSQAALVVGGGVAGMTAALALARQGYPVHLVEKSEIFGGNARRINKTFQNEDMRDFVRNLIGKVEAHDRITIYLGANITDVEGFVGNFKTEVSSGTSRTTIEHGVAILATGAEESKPAEYLYGEHHCVVTHLEMDELLRNRDPKIERAENVVFIQCVGSRDAQHPYCSKVCCTHTMKSALALKEREPGVNVYVLYRDIRTYGKREDLYKEARAKGVLFFRYSPDEKPVVTPADDRVTITFNDPMIGRKLAVDADILCLATAITAHSDQTLAKFFKVSCDEDGWFLEAHQKLRPVEFATEGVFLCGMAHYPKPVEESIAQAKAAAAKALTVLAKDQIRVGGVISRIDQRLCSGCLGCINVCPYGAISFNPEKNAAEVNEALCKGCGACAAACPSEAPVLMGFNNKQIYAQIHSALTA